MLKLIFVHDYNNLPTTYTYDIITFTHFRELIMQVSFIMIAVYAILQSAL